MRCGLLRVAFVTTFTLWTQNVLALSHTISVEYANKGITIVEPSCRLRGSPDYQINMGRWVNVSGNNVAPLPTYGPVNPVGLNLECSGKVDNVEFSFQDTGSSPLTNRNISVYDSIGGQLIEGLEVEMSYAGTRLDVKHMGEDVTTYKTNTGTHGNIKTNAADLSYLPSSTEFGARFIHRSTIQRNGVPYTGPVTGMVNLFVTYY